MANHKTGAQRRNDRMDKIFKRSEELGHHGLHGSKEKKPKDVMIRVDHGTRWDLKMQALDAGLSLKDYIRQLAIKNRK